MVKKRQIAISGEKLLSHSKAKLLVVAGRVCDIEKPCLAVGKMRKSGVPRDVIEIHKHAREPSITLKLSESI